MMKRTTTLREEPSQLIILWDTIESAMRLGEEKQMEDAGRSVDSAWLWGLLQTCQQAQRATAQILSLKPNKRIVCVFVAMARRNEA